MRRIIVEEKRRFVLRQAQDKPQQPDLGKNPTKAMSTVI